MPTHHHWSVMPEEQKPLGEMPIWARLQFIDMIPKTYFWDENPTKSRKIQEATVTGFERFGDIVWIHFTLTWEYGKVHRYIWPAVKDWGVDYGCILTPLTAPSAFFEPRDDRSYHLCDLSPGHHHHVPFPFLHCYQRGAWTWEGRYAF